MNILTIILLILLIGKIAQGYKRGMVKEIISFVSLIVLCLVVGLIGIGLNSYMQKEFLGVVVAVLLLGIVGIAHHLLGVFFFSAKVIVKLPIVHWVDKVLGIVAGIMETVLILWTIYALVNIFGLGIIGRQILEYTQGSPILLWFYNHNLLFVWVVELSGKLPSIQL